jgi:thiol:disulfide interchange protein DsbC
VPGLFEVVVDGELVYTDSSGRYAFVGGALMDMKERKDLTAAHNEKRMSILRQAPAAAGHQGSAGDGSKVFAVFEDPNCPICRVFTKFIDQLDNVTVYRFMFPVISPQSQNLARMAWCSSDRAGVWKAMMQGARPQLSESCDNSGLIKILATGERFQINNTPTVVLANGKRLVGATPPEQFLEELDKSAQRGGANEGRRCCTGHGQQSCSACPVTGFTRCVESNARGGFRPSWHVLDCDARRA